MTAVTNDQNDDAISFPISWIFSDQWPMTCVTKVRDTFVRDFFAGDIFVRDIFVWDILVGETLVVTA